MSQNQAVFPRVEFGMIMPFTLELPAQACPGVVLECQKVIRLLPRRRLVCRGQLNGATVYAKFFVHHNRREADWLDEINGNAALQQHGVRTASMICSCPLEDNPVNVVIYQALEPSVLFREAWELANRERRKWLLDEIMVILADMHEAGLLQKDLHLNNFLLMDEELYTLDAGDVKLYPDGLPGDLALSNLALFFAQLLPADMVYLDDAVAAYMQRRNLPMTAAELDKLRTAIHRKRRYRKRKYLEKAFRECSRFVSFGSFSRYVMLDREFDSDAIRNLLRDPDEAMQHVDADCIKDGNTCTITRNTISQYGLVIKRYNIKDNWHGVKRALRRSRAAISWENAHRLVFLGIPTVRPIALLEYRLGLLRRRAYLVMEHVEGPSCLDYFNDSGISEQDKQAMALRVAGLFRQLQSNKISHGDMKARNIIIHNDRPVLIDLDAMQEFNSEATFRRAMNKDINRFFANWKDQPSIQKMFVDAFQQAGIQMPVQVVRAK
jgi:tRNA A-37 threonylcarbamoyl transferase component Bud32